MPPNSQPLEDLMLDEYVRSIIHLDHLEDFLACANFDPTIYLACHLAQEVPERDLEFEILTGFYALYHRLAAVDDCYGVLDHEHDLQILDDLLSTAARVYTLIQRYMRTDGPKMDLYEVYQLVMGHL